MTEPTDTLHAQLAEHESVARAMPDLAEQVRRIAALFCTTFARGGVVYTLGNGGSAADAQHLAAELIGHYKRVRRPLPSVALTTDPSVVTCIGNDFSHDDVFRRQVEALTHPGDVVVAFTTSGRSPNVVTALAEARERGAATVLFTGGAGGSAKRYADLALVVPSVTTARIQEMHTLLLHLVSELVDAWATGEEPLPATGEGQLP